ncbi:hypothetical protein JCGZ_03508 [Jatropha curcas]|uniref:TFIIS N-terminal domain-containing protein n=1 Tax=Jatropha curcas TaxID=180498 RepID=A0A067KUZ7_JATCU|nr:uncharacterized protein LOC105632364 [Jatropha curcas]KDP39977.1 hypothetical protein JCGZ_03508 [Jatropha curcas]
MAKNPFVFPSTFSNSQSLTPSSSSSPPPSFNSYSSCPSSDPSLNSPFLSSHQSLPPPLSQNSSSPFGLPSAAVIGPCAACKILRQPCTDKCHVAAYFPPSVEPHNFNVIDSLFGHSNVVEFLQQNGNSSSYVPLLLLLKNISKDGNQRQANPSKNSNDVRYGSNININGQLMLGVSDNLKAHSYSSSSKPLMMFAINNLGTITSPANQLRGNNDLDMPADMEDESLNSNVDPSGKDDVDSKMDDGDSVDSGPESVWKSEIAKFTEKGGLVDSEGVEKLLQLMKPEKNGKKIDLVGRSVLAGVVAATDKFDCLGRFVQLRGVLVFDEWLQDVLKGNIADGRGSKDSAKSIEEFLDVVFRALDKLPIDLNALRMCTIGKSVNRLRTHKKLEIQKKARTLVDKWKKRVEAEIDRDHGFNLPVTWPRRTQLTRLARLPPK